MTQLKTLIAESVDHYTEMRVVLLQLEVELENGSASGIEELVSQFNLLCSKSRKMDRIIYNMLALHSTFETCNEQLECRRILQAEIVSLIKKNLPKANSIKSILADEVDSLKMGRKAMNGYKQNGDALGRIVNQSS